MTDTPICDFVHAYAASGAARLHMPGHKGVPLLGPEPFDITEIDGADALYEAHGIIRASERIAGTHFGAHTFFSAEGSSLCIRAMLAMAVSRAPAGARVLAARNVHKTFLYAAALLGFEPVFLPADGYLSVSVSPAAVEKMLRQGDFCAVYLTAPDYLGQIPDLAPIAAVCRRYGVPLLVDNAHGAYLKFLSPSLHPIDLGADICCDSAHKTLPALTGAAYLHVAKDDRYGFAENAKDALALFGSTSPSYLILQSLDRLNAVLKTYPEQLAAFLPKVEALKSTLAAAGWTLFGREPLKLTVDANASGYPGTALAKHLADGGVMPEYSDQKYLVCMLSPQNSDRDLCRITDRFGELPQKPPIRTAPPPFLAGERVLSVREALLSKKTRLPLSDCRSRVLAEPSVGCPPAVPILIPGERIDDEAIARFRFYGVGTLSVTENAE